MRPAATETWRATLLLATVVAAAMSGATSASAGSRAAVANGPAAISSVPKPAAVVVEPAAAARVLAQTPAVPAGYAVPIGGALSYENDAAWRRIVALSGGPGARWVVLATASDTPRETGERIAAVLRRHGATADVLPVSPLWPGVDVAQAVRDPALVARVRAARGVYFSGGAQARIVDALQPGDRETPLLAAIRDVQTSGGVVAGTSAGAAIMSTTMFRDAGDLVGALQGRLRDGEELDRGLGFVGPALFVDQHFLRRGRLARLLPAMIAKGYVLGLGVDEDTLAVVHGNVVEVAGSRAALLVDLSSARVDATRGALDVRGARLTLLEDGDRYDLATREVVPSDAKRAGRRIDPSAPGFEPYHDATPFFLDVLGETALASAMTHVVDGRAGEARGLASDAARPGAVRPELGFEFRLYRGPGTVAWFTSAGGRDAYTIANVLLDVTPVRVAVPLYSAWPK